MDAATIWEWIIKSVIVLLAMTLGFAYVTLYERKVLARMQVRIGPNRAGPFGSLQPIADAIKLIFKNLELILAWGQQCVRETHGAPVGGFQTPEGQRVRANRDVILHGREPDLDLTRLPPP